MTLALSTIGLAALITFRGWLAVRHRPTDQTGDTE